MLKQEDKCRYQAIRFREEEEKMKRLKKIDLQDYADDMKMHFLSSFISGVDKHLTSASGSVVFEKVQKKQKQFSKHVLTEFEKRVNGVHDTMDFDDAIAIAQKHHDKFFTAAEKVLAKPTDVRGTVDAVFARFDALQDQMHKKL